MLKIALNLIIKSLGIIVHLLKQQNPSRNYIIYVPLNMQFLFLVLPTLNSNNSKNTEILQMQLC